MEINRANIDEHLFEYFEGLMNPQQADALMSFIHQNPEYESDLAQWLKAYHHKTHELEDYGIASSLKKTLPKVFVFKPTYFLGFLALGVLNGWFLNHYNKVPTYTEARVENSIVEDTLKHIQKATNKGTSAYKKQPTAFQTPQLQPLMAHEDEAVQDSVPVATQTTVLQEETLDSIVTIVPLKQEPAKADTLAPQRKAPSVPLPKNKKKWGRKGVFSTTDKILPPNDNF